MFGILQGLIDAINGAFGGLFASNGYSELMPGSSFHAVTAAFATQGYWIHADMLNFVGAGDFQRFAVFIYMIALISGMVGMAMGSPPKMYVWFFMGPVLFHFLLGTTSPVMGTAWKVAGVPQEQQEVWKLAEVGLKTMNITQREGLVVNGFAPPSGGVNGNGTVNVSFAFAQLDGVVSDTIQEIIKWLGVYNGQSVGSTSGASSTGTGNDSGGRWHLLSNLKWGMLDTISQARLSSPELRDSFITFMASSCGDRFQDGIDSSRYMAASQSINGTIPPGVFTSGVTAEQYQADLNKTYSEFNKKLDGTIPTPLSIRRLLYASKDSNNVEIPQPGSFRNALLAKDGIGEQVRFFKGFTVSGNIPTPNLLSLDELLQSSGQIQCQHLLDIIVRGFRWEAAGVYTQLVRQLPVGVENPDEFDNAFLNGWDVRKYPKEKLFPATAGAKSWKQMIAEDKNPPKLDSSEDRRQFMINLILINMFKNEFLLAPNAAARKLRFTSAQSAQNAIEMYQKTVGSRNKFGEIYSWALMMPYLQGLLLYLLALGYPFACAVMLLPRCSKIIFTWASFWVWAKLWDLGFAIVVLVERSVWATIGNSSKATQLNPFIAQMLDFGTTVWQGAGAGAKIPDATKLALVGFKDPANLKLSMNSYAFLDRCMTLFSNMDLDLQNSYYIYIMAALYFAVPMMTGQLVLGAKASLAGSITGAFQQMAQEVGGRAGRALTQQMSRQAEAANQAVDQALYAKNLSAGGANSLMAQALRTQNQQAANEMYGNYVRGMSEGLSNRSAMFGNVTRARSADSDMAFGFMRTIMSDPGKVAKALAITGASASFGFNPLGAIADGVANGSQPTSSAGAGSMRNGGTGVGTVAPVGGNSGATIAMGAGGAGAGNVTPSTIGSTPSNGTVTGSTIGDGIVGGGALPRVPTNGAVGAVPQNGTTAGELFAGNFWNPMALGVEQMGRFHNYSINRMGTDTEAALLAQRADYSVDGFAINAESQRMQREGQYLMAEAKGTAQANSWYEKASYAQQFSESMGSLDVNAPQIGPKPTDDMYLARSGIAGEFAQKESFYFNNERRDGSGNLIGGGFSSSAHGYEGELRQSFGYVPVLDEKGNQKIGSDGKPLYQSALMDMYNSRTSNPANEFAFGVHNMQHILSGQLDKLSKLSIDPNSTWEQNKGTIMEVVTAPLQVMSPARYEPVIDRATGKPIKDNEGRLKQNPVSEPRAPSALPTDLRPPKITRK